MKLLLFFAAALLQTAINYATGVTRMAHIKGGVSHNVRKKLIKKYVVTNEISNDAPSYRVGEALRASPKGLARLPNIYNLERYQLFLREP